MRKMKEVTAKFQNHENVVVANRADATAGPGKLLAFPCHREEETLALPPRLAELARERMVDLVTLTGKSLEGVGIYDGDQVLCKTVFSRKEITPTSLCIVFLPDTNETLAKKVVYKKGSVILKSFHPDVEDMHFRPEQVQVQGIVLRLLRRPDEAGHFDRTTSRKQVAPAERSARINKLLNQFKKTEEELPF